MSIEALREVVSRLNGSAAALAALGAALDARVNGAPLDARLREPVAAVVSALGVTIPEALGAAELRPLLAEIRTFTLTNAKLLHAPSRTPAWEHSEPEILEAAGDVSAALPHLLKRSIASELRGLEVRLAASDAAFLDVGVGVAALSIEMARLWPSLRVVGIDPWAPALALARDRVRRAGLEHRVELRALAGEQLEDLAAFDLAWIPSLFVPEAALAKLLRRVHRALRPGGWLLVATMNAGSDALVTAVAGFRTALFGGSVVGPALMQELLEADGMVHVRTLPNRTNTLTAIVVGQRSD